MKIYERERMLKEIGFEEGHEEGREEGYKEGRAEEIVRLLCKFGKSEEEIISELVEQLKFTVDEAKECLLNNN